MARLVQGGGSKGGRRRALGFLAACAGFAVAATAAIALSGRSPAEVQASDEVSPLVGVFDSAWAVVNWNYFDTAYGGVDWPAMRERYRPQAERATSVAQLYDDAIRPMLAEIGSSHLSAHLPSETREARSTTRGIRARRGETLAHLIDHPGTIGGLDIIHDGENWIVADVKRHSVGEKRGVAPGRIVRSAAVSSIAADGDEDGLPRYRADIVLEAPDGDDEAITFEFREDGENLYDRNASQLGSGIVVLRFDEFTAPDVTWMLNRIRDTAGDAGLIIDLRHNRGGQLIQLQRLAGMFLAPGSTMGRYIDRLMDLKMGPALNARPYTGPIAILTSARSASAAEIFAHAMRHHGRAIIVGERSAGAVLVSRQFRLSDGGMMNVATGDYQAPDGVRLEDVGVIPDIEAAQTLAAVRAGRDLVMEAAERALLAR